MATKKTQTHFIIRGDSGQIKNGLIELKDVKSGYQLISTDRVGKFCKVQEIKNGELIGEIKTLPYGSKNLRWWNEEEVRAAVNVKKTAAKKGTAEKTYTASEVQAMLAAVKAES